MNGSIRSRIRLGAFALFAACMLGWGGAGIAQTATPAAGSFLVATRGQQGFFSGTVILLIAYSPDGAFGLVVNRPTKLPLAKLLPDVHGLRGDSLYLGGPVALDQLTLLIRSGTPPPGALHVVGDVYASGSMKALRALAGHKLAGARFRGYAGYAGWAPGQLDTEIEEGGWRVLPADADTVFTKAPAQLWKQLISQPDVRLVDAGRPDLTRHRIGAPIFIVSHVLRKD